MHNVSNQDLELWHRCLDWLKSGKDVALLVVADSRGSSPGRRGFKMAVSSNGDLVGSIGGGIMEMNLVDKTIHSLISKIKTESRLRLCHRKSSNTPSGLICSGEQVVLRKYLYREDIPVIDEILQAVREERMAQLCLSERDFRIAYEEKPLKTDTRNFRENDWSYTEALINPHKAYIIGGGHVGLATSRVLATLDFHVTLIDNRDKLNTLESNTYAHRKIVIPYEDLNSVIPEGENTSIVITTFGYKSDKLVLSRLLGKSYGYIGMMGSAAKLYKLFRELREEGFSHQDFMSLHAPIGICINSRTPAEIAVSIAAELIASKNTAEEIRNAV